MITKTIRFENEEAIKKAESLAKDSLMSFNKWAEKLVYQEVEYQEFLSKHN